MTGVSEGLHGRNVTRRVGVPQAYCTDCRSEVTVWSNRCLVGHTVDGPTRPRTPGRHRARPRSTLLDLAMPKGGAPLHAARPWRPGPLAVLNGQPSPAPAKPPERPSAPFERRPTRPPADPSSRPPAEPPPAPTEPPPRVESNRPLPARPGVPPTTPPPQGQRRWLRLPMLELLGFAEEDTAPSLVLDTPELDRIARDRQTAPTPAPRSDSWSLFPSLADVRRPTDDGDTGQLVAKLWEATAEHEVVRAADQWRPDEFSPKAASRRTYRWPVIVSTVASALVVLVTALTALGSPTRQVERLQSDYAALADASRQTLAELQPALAIITAHTGTPADVAEAASALTGLDSLARRLYDAATAPFPATPPLVPRGEFTSLEPARTELAAAAGAVASLQDRLAGVLAYRFGLDQTFLLPSLPDRASNRVIADLGEQLSRVTADTQQAVAALPTDPAFTRHRRQVVELAAGLESWQASYLAALRADDRTGAARQASRLTGAIDLLRSGVADPLISIAAWAEQQQTDIDVRLGRVTAP